MALTLREVGSTPTPDAENKNRVSIVSWYFKCRLLSNKSTALQIKIKR